MTVAGDMAAYVHSNTGMSMVDASKIVKLAMTCADDPNFAQRFERDNPEFDNGWDAYYAVVRFLKEMA